MPATWCGAKARPRPPTAKRRPTLRACSSPPPTPINVYALGVTAAKEVSVVESINIAMTPRQPLGMTPSALGLSADGKRLFVACSDANAAAVVDVDDARSRVEGFIPTGWYPTAVRALANGTLVVLNGKGLRSYPNAENGPIPSKRPTRCMPASPRRPPYSTWHACRRARRRGSSPSPRSNSTSGPHGPWPTRPTAIQKLDEPSPLPKIEHVIYIVKENRTYDQVLGDIKEGNGDPSLVLFGENVTPNHHKLAREFVLLDNFYVNGDVSADGHNWSTAAIAPDYVQKMWPNKYANRRTTYDFEEQDAASLPPAGYLWTNAAAAGVSMRNFGYMVNNKPNAAPGARADHRRARPRAGEGHQPVLPRLRPGLSRCGARQGFPRRNWPSTRSPATCRG